LNRSCSHQTTRKEKKLNTKTKIAAISTILTLILGGTMILLPIASAHDPPWEIPTYAYINVAPNPVGVGQQVIVVFWLDKVYADAHGTNDYRFHNFELTITKPDGTTEEKTFDTVWDSTSSQYTLCTPTQEGTYTFDFTFPGQDVNDYSHSPTSSYINDTYLPSSTSTTLTVQAEPIAGALGSSPLPSEYWTRPIYGENTEWWSISSNWLGSGSPGNTANPGVYPGDAVGPQTSHIMWTKSLQSGGVVGGDNFEVQGDTFFEGSAYRARFANPIILDGMLYYTEPISFAGVPGGFGAGAAYGPTNCVDLRTGQVIWSKQLIAPSFGYIYNMQTSNYHGVWAPILIATSGGGGFGPASSTTWIGYDADTGNWLFNATDVPAGATAMGPSGEYLTYVMANAGTTADPDWRLCQWNSSKLGTGGPGVINAQTIGGLSGIIDASTSVCYDWNISIPWRNTMTSSVTVVKAFYNDVLLCYNGSLPSFGSIFGAASFDPYTYFAVNLNASKGAVGSVLWRNTINPPAGGITVTAGKADPTTGVFVEGYQETMQWIGYSLRTGEKLWGPTASQTAFDYYGSAFATTLTSELAYGNLYSSSYGGILYCYDLTTGNLLWTYGNGGEGNSTYAGFNTPYGVYPTFIYAIGNGVIYTLTTEHSVGTPIYGGSLARAINATDGDEIWTLSNFGSSRTYAIADGFATLFNGYDNQIYSVGRGPSQTTVSAPNIAVAYGQSVVISGTVTDISSGTTQDEQVARFPNGVPVASDAIMKDWMGYVYQQKTMPSNFTGVEVVINVLDSNGNYYEIGRTTSSSNGYYSFAYTPEIPGTFNVYACFEGSAAYYGSHAETSFVIEPAPEATPTPTPTLAPMTDAYVLGMGAVAVIAIVAIGLILILMLRKR
jgi:hypothetical protein